MKTRTGRWASPEPATRATLLTLALAALLLVSACGGGTPPPKKEPVMTGPTATLPSGIVLKLTLAITEEQQETGLMYVEDLPGDVGMLFVYSEDATRPFWMKNCKIPLDLIWLSKEGVVVDITRDAPPCQQDPCPTYQASAPSRYTLEVRGGLCGERGLKVGDKVTLVGIPAN